MEVMTVLMNLFLLTFVISSMAAMGLSLTTKQIVDPLRNVKLVVLALLANFVLIPALGYALALGFQLESGLATGLILVSVVAGAPFLPKLAQVAKGDAAFSVGLMTLLMVVTIGYAPIVLPLLLEGASISAWAIAKPLIFMMLIPLAIGLFIKARYVDIAEHLQPIFGQLANYSLIIMSILMLVINWDELVSVIGTMAFIAAALFVAIAFVIGMLLGGKTGSVRSVMGLGTAQRNLGAAMAIAGANFADDPNVLVMILVVAVIGLALLMVAAGEIGKRQSAPAAGEEFANAQ